MPPPRVSVIVPLYQVAPYVAACLNSLAAQLERDFEALVIDDGSTDGSGEIAREVTRDDPRVRVIRQANAGLSAARNHGLALARGDWVAFLDGDDRVAPGWLSELLAAADAAEAPWAFCGLRFVPLPGETPGPLRGTVHSAVHDAPDLAPGTVFDLSDWRQAVRLFPSAWNKIYRRDFVGATRFDEGTWYEDHAFYWRLAARSARIGRAPAPLYWQTRSRPGQITGTASPRVLEQIEVLRAFPAIAATSAKPGAGPAHARLIARLTHERAEIIAAPALRARFAEAAAALVREAGVTPDAGAEAQIARGFLVRISGRWPLSVVIPVAADAAPWALSDTLAALAGQGFRDHETILVHDGVPSEATGATIARWRRQLPCLRQATARTRGIAAARNAGLDAARGDLVTFLDAGDRVGPPAYGGWVEDMLRAGAAFGLSAFHVGDPDRPETRLGHAGWHDLAPLGGAVPPAGPLDLGPLALIALHPHPSAKIFDRRFLRAHALRFAPGRLSAWEMTLRAGAAAGTALYQPDSGVLVDDRPPRRRVWHRAPGAGEIDALLSRLAPLGSSLPTGWERRLAARAAWEGLQFGSFESAAARADYRAALEALATARGWQDGADVPLDPFLDPVARWLVTGRGARPDGGADAAGDDCTGPGEPP